MIKEKDRLLGYSNPTCAYPAPLVAVVSSDNRYCVIYPSGARECVDYHPSNHADFISLGQESKDLYASSRDPDTFLYGISRDHILIGGQKFVSKRLREILTTLDSKSPTYIHISQFLDSLSTALSTK